MIEIGGNGGIIWLKHVSDMHGPRQIDGKNLFLRQRRCYALLGDGRMKNGHQGYFNADGSMAGMPVGGLKVNQDGIGWQLEEGYMLAMVIKKDKKGRLK